MPSPLFSLDDAMHLGQFIQAAYDLFDGGDPVDFAPPLGYSLVSKLYADDITDDLPDYKARHNIGCWHALATYLNTLDPTAPLTTRCQP